MLSIYSSEFAITNQPDGILELSHRIYYSAELSGYLEEFEGNLTFFGDDYTYLRGRFINDGCAVVPVTLYDSCGLTLTANLFMNDAKWRPDLCTVECQVVDDSFLSLIDNNKDIKAYLNVARSKNDVAITAVTQTDLTFTAYDSVNNSNTPADRCGVRVYDALRMLVEFMSDGLIGFESDFFFPDDDPAVSRPRIPTLITGRAIRSNVTDSYPFISFEELFKDLNRLYNLAFAVERTSAGVILRIEPKSYFRDNSPTLTMLNVASVEQTSDASSLYSKVTYGTYKQDEFVFYPGGASPPSLPFVAWSQEEYHLGGQCNNQSVLELQLETLITDTNVIMRCLPYGAPNPQTIVNPPDTSYDEDVFIVVFDANNFTIQNDNPIYPTLRYYNGRLTNAEVAQRWGDGIPYPIFLFLDGVTNNDAKGGLSANASVDTDPLMPFFLGQWFADNIGISAFCAIMEFPVRTFPIGYDPSGNMVDGVVVSGPSFNATWYAAPNTGVYSMRSYLNWQGNMYAFIIAQVRAGVLVQTSEIFQVENSTSTLNRELNLTMSVAAEAGDRFYVICAAGGGATTVFPPILKVGSYFEVFAQANQITQTYDPADNYLINSSFNYPMASNDWQSFVSSKFGVIEITHANGAVRGFLKEANRKLNDGMTEFVIRSNFANS